MCKNFKKRTLGTNWKFSPAIPVIPIGSHLDKCRGQRNYVLHRREASGVKKLIVALGILGLYMAADACLTAWGLGLGLREGNPFVNTNNLMKHTALCFASMSVLAVLIYQIGKGIDRQDIVHKFILGIAVFYVYVLLNNLYYIARCYAT